MVRKTSWAAGLACRRRCPQRPLRRRQPRAPTTSSRPRLASSSSRPRCCRAGASSATTCAPTSTARPRPARSASTTRRGPAPSSSSWSASPPPTDVIDAVSPSRAPTFTRAHVQPQDGQLVGAGRHLHRHRPARLRRGVMGRARHLPRRRVHLRRRLRGHRPGRRARRRRSPRACSAPTRPARSTARRTITLSAAGDADAVVLAYLHVAAAPSASSGAAHRRRRRVARGVPVVDHASAATSRPCRAPPARPSRPRRRSTGPTSRPARPSTYSGVQLAIEVLPSLDVLNLATGPGGVWLGGLTDPWNGTIGSAGAYDPVTGDPIWSFP